MTDIKNLLQSKTVWANIIGFIALVFPAAAPYTGLVDPEGAAGAVSHVIAGISFLASTWARFVATKQLSVSSTASSTTLRLLPLLLILPFLGGCVTTDARAQLDAQVGTLITQVDTKVGTVSAEVQRYCGLTKTGLSLADVFINDTKGQLAIDYATATVTAYCDQPVTDVRTALDALYRAYQGVAAVYNRG